MGKSFRQSCASLEEIGILSFEKENGGFDCENFAAKQWFYKSIFLDIAKSALYTFCPKYHKTKKSFLPLFLPLLSYLFLL